MKYLISVLLLFSLGCSRPEYKIGSCLLDKKDGYIWVVLDKDDTSYLLRKRNDSQYHTIVSLFRAYNFFERVGCYPGQ